MFRALLILLAATLGGSLRAHTVPEVMIEAEFSGTREAVIKVNLDPRLFLTPEPAKLPPVSASWWFEQDEAAKAASRRSAAEYVDRTFTFTVGTTPLKGSWKVEPIDSASYFPLGQTSAEAHLLLEHRGRLPDAPGDFKVAIGKECPVQVILLCSNAGNPERKPDLRFPGETSRPYPLPAISPPAPNAAASATSPSAFPAWMSRIAFLARSAHFMGDHLALAALLGFALSRRCWRAIGLLLAFHAVDTLAACAVIAGWLPSAPPWMTIAYWIVMALAAISLLALRSDDSSVLASLTVAGLCHGLNTPHLHLDSAAAEAGTLLLAQTGTLFILELAVLAACASLFRLARRRHLRASCTSTA